MIHILGNLACEQEWAGRPPVPAHVARRIAALATLMRALVDDEVTMWSDVAIDPARLPAVTGLRVPTLAVGRPPAGAAVIAWGASAQLAGTVQLPIDAITRGAAMDPALRAALAAPVPSVAVARAVNDRRFALDLARRLGCALDGASVVETVGELAPAIAAATAATPGGSWIAKAVLTSAGRARAIGHGGPSVDHKARARADQLLAEYGALVVEPWLSRVRDLGITGAIDADGEVAVLEPHRLQSGERGGFEGIELRGAFLAAADGARLTEVAHGVGRALAVAGHRGPYTIDAFLHRDGAGHERLHPLVEINARLSFGVIARALASRIGGWTRLRVETATPAWNRPTAAVILVAPTATDRSAAWLE